MLACFSCPPDWPLYHKIRFDFDWDVIKKEFFEEVPRQNDKHDHNPKITSPIPVKQEENEKKDEKKDEKEKEKKKDEKEKRER